MGSSKGVGIPIKLFHESEGHVLTVRGTWHACIAVAVRLIYHAAMHCLLCLGGGEDRRNV